MKIGLSMASTVAAVGAITIVTTALVAPGDSSAWFELPATALFAGDPVEPAAADTGPVLSNPEVAAAPAPAPATAPRPPQWSSRPRRHPPQRHPPRRHGPRW